MTEERAFWVAWSQITGIGPILLRRLHQHFGTLEAAWIANAADLQRVEGFGWQTAETITSARSKLNPVALLEQHEQNNPCFWTLTDPDYPRLLLEIADPPAVVYYHGTIDSLEAQGFTPTVAIVGTRSPSEYGKRWTRKLTLALAKAGYTIISGLADGIDTIAHQACVEVNGRTIAVLGTGVDVVYPWRNRELSKRIPEQGLLLSEYPAGTQPDRVHFPRRNRIIAGLSRVTLVLEAPERSGALITARLANDYGRDVYALPASLDNPRGRGCLDLLTQGAAMILGEAELLEALENLPHLTQTPPWNASFEQGTLLDSNLLSAPSEPKLPPHLQPELQQVLQSVSSEPIAFDLIVQQSGLATPTVSSALSQLELMELVEQLPGMRYQKT